VASHPDEAARRILLVRQIPTLARRVGVWRWFSMDMAGAVDPGELEVAFELPAMAPDPTTDVVRTHLSSATELLVDLAPPRVLDPDLHGGSAPPAPFAELLAEGTRRAVAWLASDPPSSWRTPTAEAVHLGEIVALVEALVPPDERAACLHRHATWLEGIAGCPPRVATVDRPIGVAPYHDASARRFRRAVDGLPTAHRDELVARLAHIQVVRLTPGSPLDREAALVRGLASTR
jgi:hypothetical protein